MSSTASAQRWSSRDNGISNIRNAIAATSGPPIGRIGHGPGHQYACETLLSDVITFTELFPNIRRLITVVPHNPAF